MYANLVCKGGGIKAIALIGALDYLETKDYQWSSAVGTSAGAMIAGFIAAGYTPFEIKEMMNELNYALLKDKNKTLLIPYIGDILSFWLYKGLYKGDYIQHFIADKLKAKQIITFKDLSENGMSKLKMIAADVTQRRLLLLPDDLIAYGINPMSFEVAKAIRMSISIPFFYNPVKLQLGTETHYIVDGGLMSNFPLWVFEPVCGPVLPTIGLNLLDNDSHKSSTYTPLMSYAIDVIETSLNTPEASYYRDDNNIKLINIPTLGIHATDFNLTKDEMDDLYLSGYNAAKQLFI